MTQKLPKSARIERTFTVKYTVALFMDHSA